jgi:hypothetical protein
MSASVSLTDLQQVAGAVGAVNAAGHAVPLTVVPVWAGADPAVVKLIPSADGLSCEVVAVAVGSTAFTVTATLADGTVITAPSVPVTVSASVAVGLVVTIGTPELIPAS